MKDTPTNKPWIADGDNWIEYEDYLIGNKEGLAELRNKIDTALHGGECKIPRDDNRWFSGVKIVDHLPELAKPSKTKDIISMMPYLFFAVIFFFGIGKMIELFK